MSFAPPSPVSLECDRTQRLRKVEEALEQMATHCRNLCEQVKISTPPVESEKSPLWAVLEKDAALSQKILALIGALLTQEKRLATLLPDVKSQDRQDEAIDWPMLDSYFTRRKSTHRDDDFE